MIPARLAAGASAPPANLTLRGLSKTFSGVRVLDDVDIEVGFGEVHGLLGQNGSGKSTLIKILGGTYSPDAGGEVTLGGTVVPLPVPPGSFNRYGIAIVHQALGLVSSLSVTENLLVRDLVRERNIVIDWRSAHRKAAVVLSASGLDIDPAALVSSLAPVERALIGIVRAFREIEQSAPSGGGLLILDEPTPFLPRADVERLFALVRQAVSRGTSVLFVSHDVDEIMELTHRATVLRNGRVAATLVTKQATKAQFIAAIVGRHLDDAPPERRALDEAPSVVVSDLAGEGIDTFNLGVRRGEIVGLTGLLGSGYDRVPYLLYGAAPATGTLAIGDKRVDLARFRPQDAIGLGAVLVPGDRQRSAVADGLTVAENLVLPMLGRALPAWFITRSRINAIAHALVRTFDIRPADSSKLVRFLSGGNQQKVVLAKWLQMSPRLILLDEPTQGVDVGARQHIFAIIRQAAAGGTCVFCASSDHEQLASICDRVLIFSRGRVIASLSGTDVTKQNISEHCYGDAAGVLPVELGAESVVG